MDNGFFNPLSDSQTVRWGGNLKALKIAGLLLLISILPLPATAQNIELIGSYPLDNSFDVVVEWPRAYVCQHGVYPSFIILDISDPTSIQPERR